MPWQCAATSAGAVSGWMLACGVVSPSWPPASAVLLAPPSVAACVGGGVLWVVGAAGGEAAVSMGDEDSLTIAPEAEGRSGLGGGAVCVRLGQEVSLGGASGGRSEANFSKCLCKVRAAHNAGRCAGWAELRSRAPGWLPRHKEAKANSALARTQCAARRVCEHLGAPGGAPANTPVPPPAAAPASSRPRRTWSLPVAIAATERGAVTSHPSQSPSPFRWALASESGCHSERGAAPCRTAGSPVPAPPPLAWSTCPSHLQSTKSLPGRCMAPHT